jgi:hypothetical protein
VALGAGLSLGLKTGGLGDRHGKTKNDKEKNMKNHNLS